MADGDEPAAKRPRKPAAAADVALLVSKAAVKLSGGRLNPKGAEYEALLEKGIPRRMVRAAWIATSGQSEAAMQYVRDNFDQPAAFWRRGGRGGAGHCTAVEENHRAEPPTTTAVLAKIAGRLAAGDKEVQAAIPANPHRLPAFSEGCPFPATNRELRVRPWSPGSG